jgi:hypothetical protein
MGSYYPELLKYIILNVYFLRKIMCYSKKEESVTHTWEKICNRNNLYEAKILDLANFKDLL